ncbi:unnamed protein product [Orchesella dallaii]|uniref:Chitin-binding type-2 domain-containing protein n=1 Tax=Orchesella dallaii TaxID=48710 RepID=A0ABP1PQG5_9HEXA
MKIYSEISFNNDIINLLIIGVANSERRWSVRKTGEFGRRVGVGVETTTTIPQELQLPTKQFRLHEPTLELAETRRYDQFYGAVRKPSQSLQLPKFEGTDQEAQETADEEGYAYAKPDEDGYSYDQPDPIPADTPPEDPESAVPQPPLPDPSDPELVAGPGDAFITPLQQEQINAESLRASKLALTAAQSPKVTAIASDHSGDSCTDDNDPNCWPHGYEGVISGVAGTDYPILSEIVPTDFNCDDQQFSGYYADTDERARCQVFHVCLKGNKYRRTRQWSFLCPNGTIYSQSDFVCVWWADAPECNGGTVRSLYSLNEQLGWDNVTEGSSSPSSSRRNSNFRSGNSNQESLQSAMSALSPASTSSHSRNSAYVANPSIPTTFRPSSTKGTQASSARTALPYRVPVKVNGNTGRARTKLQEVTQNALHGAAHELDYGDDTEHDVDESSNFETSLRQQSESRHKSKTASALHKSTSEAYELKGAPDAIQPFVVNRPNGKGVDGQTELPAPSGEYTDGEDVSPHVVMMPSLQRYPDGSEGYAEVPVMFPHGTTDASEGYRYPTPTEPTSTPGPTYLPPFNEYAAARETPSTTTENYPTPTIPTEPPLDNDNYEADYQSTTTEQPTTTTDRSAGYRYTESTTTDAGGYRYPNPTAEDDQTGYNYPNPTQTAEKSAAYRNTNTNPTTTEESSGYKYPSPTKEEDGYRYPKPANEEDGYRYPKPAKEEDGYRYPKPAKQVEDADTSGYRYPNPTQTTENPAGIRYTNTNPTTTEQTTGYSYTNPTTTEQSAGYRYTNTNPTTTEQPTSYSYADSTTTEQSGGYRYPDPTTTEQNGRYRYTDSTTTVQSGYTYTEPTTTVSSAGYSYTNPSTTPTTTEQTTTEDASGYQYPVPNQKEQLRETSESGYSYPTPTTPTTTQQPTTTTSGPTQNVNEDYQVTSNDVSGGYQPETTRSPETPRPVYGVPDSQTTFSTERNQQPVSTTPTSTSTTTNEVPVGAYLPPSNNEVVDDGAIEIPNQEEEEGGDEDTVDIPADDESDYEDEENEVTGSTGPADEGGYSYHLPTPPSSNPVVLNGGNLGTLTQLYIPNLREQISAKKRKEQTGSTISSLYYNTGKSNTADSDEKLNEILRKIQNGGIDVLDESGKPIAFNKLKTLLLTSPRGSVELRGEADSATSSSTEVPASPQQPPKQQEHSYFNTITTATILPNNNNNNNLLFTTNQNQLSGAAPSPTGFYLPPNSNNNNNNNQQSQQYYPLSNNAQAPGYEIKLPTKEFESHSVETNAIDINRNNNNNNNAFTQSQYQSQSGNIAFTTSTITNNQQQAQPQQQQYQEVNIPFSSVQNQAIPQQQFFNNQPSYSSPVSREPTPTQAVIPSGNYLPPQQQDFERQSLLNNLVLPATQTQPQQQQNSQQGSFAFNGNQQNNNNYAPLPPSTGPLVKEAERQYLPPRQTSSILQSQYYTAEASQQPKPIYVSQPVQLTENIQLQQSFSRPLPPQTANNNNNNNDRNPGVKDIKIVPALFVHQHTSVASQSEQQQNIQGNIIENVFQTLEASPSTYLPSGTGGSRFGARNSLAQQLNQIASNSANLPRGLGGRQFTRRSNSNGGSRSSSSSSSSSSVTIEKAPPVSTFTLEDARTPDELQKYHHQDLKRFHKENIATQGSVLDDSGSAPHQPPRANSATRALIDSSHNSNRNVHRSHHTEEDNRGSSRRGNSGSGSSSTNSNSNNSNSPSRFSISSTSILDNSRGSGGSEDFFIPVSGSFGSGGGSSSSSSRSTRSRGSSRKSGRGFLDSESETTLLRRFLPEEEGGFGSRLL